MLFASLPGQLQGAPPMVTTDVEPGLDGKMKNKVHTEPVTERPHGLWDRRAVQAQEAGRWRKFSLTDQGDQSPELLQGFWLHAPAYLVSTLKLTDYRIL